MLPIIGTSSGVVTGSGSSVDTVNDVVEAGEISMNETCSSSIGTPPSFGQSVYVLM